MGFSVFDHLWWADLLTSHHFRSCICAVILEGWWRSYGCGKPGFQPSLTRTVKFFLTCFRFSLYMYLLMMRRERKRSVTQGLTTGKAKAKANFTNARRALLTEMGTKQPNPGAIKAYMDVLGPAAMEAVEAIVGLAKGVEVNAHLFQELAVLDREFAEVVTRASDVLETSIESSSPATIEWWDTVRQVRAILSNRHCRSWHLHRNFVRPRRRMVQVKIWVSVLHNRPGECHVVQSAVAMATASPAPNKLGTSRIKQEQTSKPTGQTMAPARGPSEAVTMGTTSVTMTSAAATSPSRRAPHYQPPAARSRDTWPQMCLLLFGGILAAKKEFVPPARGQRVMLGFSLFN